ncbi:hypothetical protein BO86DRAFT_63461 [Aspergillus japonicus CBS 114.51]|uniref:DUF7587 domain-containing protein n=1 Tax=Aspergillus japonicus CBS 114.51 TaxID=1448312 RepID=A0A8T8X496_ASPJA|nr:hypothetical protein BO86DRAFT_63461 [Aspergillus japonicus CBS 114.51]RAH82896.1 hypothetical protein BO86DRAFT_63461 [Aspergillus japonicus CBS 114.51]
MAYMPSQRYFYRCFSKTSAGALRCGLARTGPPLSESDLLLHFEQHMISASRNRTALVSTTDRPIEAIHRAFVKYYNLNERADDIWIAIISVPVGENKTLPCHRAEKLALKLGYRLEESKKFMHEYIFEWEIEHQYVKHMVSVETLLKRGLDLDTYLQNDRLPSLRGFRDLMIDMIVEPPADGYSVGIELGRMARCFGARAPVEKIAHSLLRDCPTNIFVHNDGEYVTWKRSGAEPVDIDFEHIYWIQQGIDEALFDLWLADIDFIEDRITHAELANALTSEMEILWELYWEDVYFDAWDGVNSDSAADKAQKLRCREQEIHNQIERHAVSIGL